MEVYDPQADSWQQVASMPRGLSAHAAVAMGGKIYVTGGSFPGMGSVKSVYVYDPQADAWTQLASMNAVRQCHASAAVDGKLYVFGGMNLGGDIDSVEVYDPASSDRWTAWTLVSSLTSACHSSVAIAL